MKRCIALALPVVLSLALARQADAQYVQQEQLSFSAENQSMWGPGEAWGWNYSDFLGLSWDVTQSIGGIAGHENEVIIPHGCIWFFGTHCWGDVTADTRTGLLITAETDGRIGLDVGVSVTSGEVDVLVPGAATISTSSLTANVPGTPVTIQTDFAVDPMAGMHTVFPTVEMYADFVFDVYAGGSYQACFVIAGCTGGSGALMDVNEAIPLVSLNRDGDGLLKVLGQEVPMSGTIDPPGIDYEFFAPSLETGVEAVATDLVASGESSLLELGVDVPSLIADMILPGSGYLLGGDAFGFSYTILSAALGPRFGIGQEFTFTSTPMTTLTFSEEVSPVVGGETLDPTLTFDVPLGSSFDFLYPDAETLDITPTYWLQNSLNVDTDLLSRMGFELTMLELQTPLGGLGPLFHRDFQTDALPIGIDDRTFSVAFNSYTGESFQLSTIPEPATLLLLGSGLVVVGALGWRRRRQG